MSKFERITARTGPALMTMPDFLKVLVVADQLFDRRRLHRMVAGLGIETQIIDATSVNSMAVRLENCSFDLIVVDDTLPDGTGLHAHDALRHSKKNCLAATVIVINDQAAETGFKALEGGFGDYIPRGGLTPEAFRHACTNALQKSYLYNALETQGHGRRHLQSALNRLPASIAEDAGPLVSLMIQRLQDMREPAELTAEERTKRHADLENARTSLAVLLNGPDGK